MEDRHINSEQARANHIELSFEAQIALWNETLFMLLTCEQVVAEKWGSPSLREWTALSIATFPRRVSLERLCRTERKHTLRRQQAGERGAWSVVFLVTLRRELSLLCAKKRRTGYELSYLWGAPP